jgi:hypothetical protein
MLGLGACKSHVAQQLPDALPVASETADSNADTVASASAVPVPSAVPEAVAALEAGVPDAGVGQARATASAFESGIATPHRLGDPIDRRKPVIRQGATTVNGRLPPELIQRVVRGNLPRFMKCYTDGLRGNPSLQGRVAVKFVIARDGTVSTIQDGLRSSRPERDSMRRPHLRQLALSRARRSLHHAK